MPWDFIDKRLVCKKVVEFTPQILANVICCGRYFVDDFWSAINNVNDVFQESECGWCKDKWGLSWQITPRALMAAIADPDQAVAKRAFEAMMEMKKIDIAAIEAARRG